jgi:hypothetical protein
MPSAPDAAHAAVRERLERALGQPAIEWITPDTGLSAAARYSVTLHDGSRVFVKAATDEDTERWLRTEYLALRQVPERFVPDIVTWLDEPGTRPILVVEDLRGAHWPASHQGVDWRHGDIDRVLAAVADLSRIPAPLEFAPSSRGPALWPQILHPGPDRDAFLRFRLCTEEWLEYAGSSLTEAESGLTDSGDRLVHGDLRSDNICVADERVVFVDWSNASRGHAEHDVAALLPTLHLEGGPLPYSVMPCGAGWAAAGCVALIRRVIDEQALPQWLAAVFMRIAAIDLSWAASCLDLHQPDGTSWKEI